MQTFLPEFTFALAVSRLDWRRLGKQRVEAAQIIKALSDPTYGWQHHPADRERAEGWNKCSRRLRWSRWELGW